MLCLLVELTIQVCSASPPPDTWRFCFVALHPLPNIGMVAANFGCLGYMMMDPMNMTQGVMALLGTTAIVGAGPHHSLHRRRRHAGVHHGAQHLLVGAVRGGLHSQQLLASLIDLHHVRRHEQLAPNALFVGSGTIEGTATTTTYADTVADELINAKSVIMVPGYGVAVAKAQDDIAEMV
mmetsp:Transcript_31229/g.62976  ORF Transcript_31229/g.62976 Transcript_31229/m.62976 type:complete len:180 (+) Transcript_31229:359-898(+)